MPAVTFLTGTVLRSDPDPVKQRPVANALITATSGIGSGETTSDAAGFFSLSLRPAVEPGETVRLTFRHPDYNFLTMAVPVTEELRVVRLAPRTPAGPAEPEKPQIVISNVRLRYALRSISTVDVGSAVRIFAIANKGNVPCNGRQPCSPDGKWKAAIDSISLDAGPDQQFRNARVSCIAGPCPFTKIEADEFSRGGRVIRAAVRNWSDTVAYLLEAEVAQVVASDIIRHSYPVIFGRTMNFTLPPPALGPSIEAEVDSLPIVFPLGPNLTLSWAVCRMEVGADRTRLYRCELKPPYRFK